MKKIKISLLDTIKNLVDEQSVNNPKIKDKHGRVNKILDDFSESIMILPSQLRILDIGAVPDNT